MLSPTHGGPVSLAARSGRAAGHGPGKLPTRVGRWKQTLRSSPLASVSRCCLTARLRLRLLAALACGRRVGWWCGCGVGTAVDLYVRLYRHNLREVPFLLPVASGEGDAVGLPSGVGAGQAPCCQMCTGAVGQGCEAASPPGSLPPRADSPLRQPLAFALARGAPVHAATHGVSHALLRPAACHGENRLPSSFLDPGVPRAPRHRLPPPCCGQKLPEDPRASRRRAPQPAGGSGGARSAWRCDVTLKVPQYLGAQAGQS